MTTKSIYLAAHRQLLAGAVGLAVICSASIAFAEDPVIEGKGYLVGEGTVLRPQLGIETLYDSNVFYEDSSPVGAPVLRVSGAVALASADNKQPGTRQAEDLEEDREATTKTPPSVSYRMGAELGYEKYFESRRTVTNQSNLTARAKVDAVFNPAGTFSFFVKDNYTRDSQPTNFEDTATLTWNVNDLTLGVNYKPGGDAFLVSLRYNNYLHLFESSDSSFANRMNHTLALRSEWQWLPITRFFFETSYGFFGGVGDGSPVSSNPLRIQLGASTLLTERTSIRAHAGFGKGFYSEGADYTSFLAGAEFGYRYTEFGRFRVAYSHDFRDSINASFYIDDAVTFNIDHQFGVFLLAANAGIRLRRYENVQMEFGSGNRSDIILNMRAKGHYLFRDWVAATATFDFVSDQTDFRATVMGDDPSFTRFEAILGLMAAF